MGSASNGAFCLYLWRAADAPGAIYMAKNIHVAQALYGALDEEGYLVKAVKLDGDVEYKMTGGALVPAGRSR